MVEINWQLGFGCHCDKQWYFYRPHLGSRDQLQTFYMLSNEFHFAFFFVLKNNSLLQWSMESVLIVSSYCKLIHCWEI